MVPVTAEPQTVPEPERPALDDQAGPDVPEPPAVLLASCESGEQHRARWAWRMGYAAAAADRPADGPMLAAVKTDLDALGEIDGGRRTLRQIALWLAGVIDKRGSEEGPSTTAKLATELRATMAALTRKGDGDDDGWDDFTRGISTPTR